MLNYLPLEHYTQYATLPKEEFVKRFPHPVILGNPIKKRKVTSVMTHELSRDDLLKILQKEKSTKKTPTQVVYPVIKTGSNGFDYAVFMGSAGNNDIELGEAASKMHAHLAPPTEHVQSLIIRPGSSPEQRNQAYRLYLSGQGDIWTITDHNSTNGVLLDGKKITAAQATPLPDGSTISLAGFVTVFYLPQTFYERIK